MSTCTHQETHNATITIDIQTLKEQIKMDAQRNTCHYYN